MNKFKERGIPEKVAQPEIAIKNLWIKVKDLLLGVKDVFNGLTEEERAELEQRAKKISEMRETFNNLFDRLFQLYEISIKEKGDDRLFRTRFQRRKRKDGEQIKDIYKELKDTMGMDEGDMVLLGFHIKSFNEVMSEKID